MSVRTRFAPSPTGYLHIGGARTALFSWLYARKMQGQFVLRIEDTDRERSSPEAVEAILAGLSWLGLDWDAGPYYQTQRTGRYQEVIRQLFDADLAYYCYCTKEELDELRAQQERRKEKPRYDGRYRDYQGPPRAGVDPVVRFKNPLEGTVVVEDIVKGHVSYRNTELDDLVIARADGTPTYNFTVVVDDMDMGITHVIRGDDHLNNTPRQINIFHALGAKPPRYAHIPLIHGTDGKKLSKRHGAFSVTQYREEGYLPEALLNYLVRLGWSHGDQEIFAREAMIELFDVNDINTSASTFNPEKLLWLNQHYLKHSRYEQVADALKAQFAAQHLAHDQGPDVKALFEVQQERTKTLKELVDQSRYFFEDFDAYDDKAARKHLKAEATPMLKRLRDTLAELPEWYRTPIHEAIIHFAEAEQLKLGKVAQPLRVAVTGGSTSPSIDITLELVGKPRTLARIERAIQTIEVGALA